ncbi:MAG: SIS domain-containing protein [Candidatus Buchananbacteria bacterium]
MDELTQVEQEILDDMLRRRADLGGCVRGILALHEVLVGTYDKGGKLLVCGNGGSHADATHIVGELCKSFERRRPIDPRMADRLKSLPFGAELAQHLEVGLPAIALGLCGPLTTAIGNDNSLRDIAFAQETLALAKPGDVLIAISTSGNASDCIMAMSVMEALGGFAVALTGPVGGEMAEQANIVIRAPGDSTKVIQEAHIVIYHTICALIEAHYFPERR